jgi:hypothetical protein
MISRTRTHKVAVLIVAYVMVACVAALLSVNLTSPTSVALGADWQCSRFALVFTSCIPVHAPEAVPNDMRKLTQETANAAAAPLRPRLH